MGARRGARHLAEVTSVLTEGNVLVFLRCTQRYLCVTDFPKLATTKHACAWKVQLRGKLEGVGWAGQTQGLCGRSLFTKGEVFLFYFFKVLFVY